MTTREDDLFHLLPLPAARWPVHSPRQSQTNRAYRAAFQDHALPPPVTAWGDGVHQTRLLTRGGERRICRLNLSTLPGGDRLLLIEDVHTYHLDPLTGLPDRAGLVNDALQTAGVTGVAALHLTHLGRARQAMGDVAVDSALRALARDLKRAARHWTGEAYRTGSQDFALCTPHALSPDQLSPLLGRLTRRLEVLGPGRAAVQWGLAHAPHDGHTLEDLLDCAASRQVRDTGLVTRLRERLGLGLTDTRRDTLHRLEWAAL